MANRDAGELFREFIQDTMFPCVGAKSALARDALVVHIASDIERPMDDVNIHRALQDFSKQLDVTGPVMKSFAVIFDNSSEMGEEAFEKALWNRLQCLHNLDVLAGMPWHPAVDADPASPHFSLSVGGEPYFVIGLHPKASRPARRFARPTLVFNSHLQFEKLRADGQFEKMKTIIRERDTKLAGHVNPMLSNHGKASEARQYSGRMVGKDWKCPFTRIEVG